MVKLSQSEVAFIKENFENYEELLSAKKAEEILFLLDRLILTKGYSADYVGLNELGKNAKKVYDDIYDQNVDKNVML